MKWIINFFRYKKLASMQLQIINELKNAPPKKEYVFIAQPQAEGKDEYLRKISALSTDHDYLWYFQLMKRDIIAMWQRGDIPELRVKGMLDTVDMIGADANKAKSTRDSDHAL